MEAISVHHNEARRRYEVALPDGQTAFIAYELEEGEKALVHTIVPPAHEGKGIAAALAKYALEEARARGEKVWPYCPYVQAYLQRHPEYADAAHPL